MGIFTNAGQRFQLRSAQSFFDASSFGAPRNLGQLTNRLSTNIEYYQANYSILVALVLAYVCYHNLSVFFTLALTGALGYYLFNVRTNSLSLSGRTFSESEILVGFATGAGSLLAWMGGSFLMYSMAFAGSLILIHAGLKGQTLSAKATNAVNDVFDKIQ